MRRVKGDEPLGPPACGDGRLRVVRKEEEQQPHFHRQGIEFFLMNDLVACHRQDYGGLY